MGAKNDTNKYLKKFPEDLKFSYFLSGETLPHQGSFVKRSTFDKIGKYNIDFSICADRLHFILAICKYNMTYKHIDIPISYYDMTGYSSKKENRLQADEEFNTIMKNNFEIYLSDYAEAKKNNNILVHLKQSRLIKLLKSIVNKVFFVAKNNSNNE